MTAERIVILGSGGHAREVLEILLASRASGRDLEPIGFIDPTSDLRGRLINGLPVLGDFRWFEGVDRSEVAVISAVGTPSVSEELVGQARLLGLRFASAISPRAWIATSARIEEGTMVFPNVVVNANASVGAHVTLNVAVTISHDSQIGAFSSIGPGVHVAGNVTVGERCFVGMGANVIQGLRVGQSSVIGAGAVVIEDVPADVTVVGVPARVIGPATSFPMGPPRALSALQD